MQEYPHLFAPIEIAGHTYRNRILAAPMIFGFVALRGPEIAQNLYRLAESRAKGGAAEVVVGETPVNCSDAPDILFPGTEVDYSVRKGPAFDTYRGYAEAIKRHGALALIQIFHAGHAKNPLPFGDKPNPWGPMGFVREDGVTVEAFDAARMQKVRQDFVTCAWFMQAAGFDGVLIHGAHGFLFTQFLSPADNRRSDEYGGSLENRGRFPREILRDIKTSLGPDFIVELRINGADLVEGGTTAEETAAFCATLDGLVDIIHISCGFKAKGHDTQVFSSMYHPHGVNVERAAVVKQQTKIPVTAVGGINDPAFAERVIAEGKVDFVSLGRQMLADPEFANKARSGREDEIRRCLRCYYCYPGMPEVPGDSRSMVVPDMKSPPPNVRKGLGVGQCTVNPASANEIEIENMPAPQGHRKVLVVGGGPGGLQAAITAADRGHRVTLVEKEASLGGTLAFTDSDAYKTELRDFKDLLVREVEKRDIEVRLNTAATSEFIREFQPDALILAIGASPAAPPLPGLEQAVHALDVYKKDAKVGKKVVMLGGGLAGCETALHLAARGHQVTIVEMQERLAPEATGLALTAIIRQIEKDKNIAVRTGAECVAITPQSVKVACGTAEEVIAGDSVVYSLGMEARRDEAAHLRSAAGDAAVFEVGDCVRGAKVFEAVSEGFMAAMKII